MTDTQIHEPHRGTSLSRRGPDSDRNGQMDHHLWIGYMGHESLPATHDAVGFSLKYTNYLQ